MPKLKRKLGRLFAILIFSSSCAGLPQKPSIDICAHDQPRHEALCSNNQTGKEFDIPIEQTDKFIMFNPDHWGLILLYIRQLETHVRSDKSKNQFIADELEKVINTSEKFL